MILKLKPFICHVMSFFQHIFAFKNVTLPSISTPFTYVGDNLFLDDNSFESYDILSTNQSTKPPNVLKESEPQQPTTDQHIEDTNSHFVEPTSDHPHNQYLQHQMIHRMILIQPQNPKNYHLHSLYGIDDLQLICKTIAPQLLILLQLQILFFHY